MEEDVLISATNGFGYPVLTQDKISVKQREESLAKVTLFLIPLEPLHILCLFKTILTVIVCRIYKPYSRCKISYAGLI